MNYIITPAPPAVTTIPLKPMPARAAALGEPAPPRTALWLLALALVIIIILVLYFYFKSPEYDNLLTDVTTETTVDVTTETTVDVTTETTVDVTTETTVDVATETTVDVATETTVDVATITCGIDFNCEGNTHPKGNMPSIQCVGSTCGNSECCDPNQQCVDFTCGENTHIDVMERWRECVGETCENSECCDDNPICENFPCGGNTHPRGNVASIQCSGRTCRNSECCDDNPICADFTCGGNTHPKGNMASTQCGGETCENSECCDENPICENFPCVENTHPKDNMRTTQCGGATCGNSDCCDENPICADFTCEGNTHPKGNMQSTQCGEGTCGNSECCDPNPTCEYFNCEGNTHPKGNMSSIQCAGGTCGNSECCDPNPTCADGRGGGAGDTWDNHCRSKTIGVADKNPRSDIDWSNHNSRAYMKGKIPVPGMETSGEIQRCSSPVCTEEDCCDYIKCNELSTDTLNDICVGKEVGGGGDGGWGDLFVPYGSYDGVNPHHADPGDSPSDRCCEPDNYCWLERQDRPVIECSDFNEVGENKEDTHIYYHDRTYGFSWPSGLLPTYQGNDPPAGRREARWELWDKGGHEPGDGTAGHHGKYRSTCCHQIFISSADVLGERQRDPINELTPRDDGSPRWAFCPNDENGNATEDCGPIYGTWEAAWFNSLEEDEWRDPQSIM
jgi:hypothetical protein